MANGQIIEITADNFEAEVKNSEKPVLIDFWASWCGPCLMLAPVIDEIAEEYPDKYKICKVNVDNESTLAQTFGVMSIPMLAVFKNGQIYKKTVGVQPKEAILDMFN